MRERVSDTLLRFNHRVPPASDTIRRAVDAYVNLYVNTLTVDREVESSLAELAPEYRLGLVTNFSYPPGAYRTIDRFGLRRFFEAIVVSGELGWRKPSPRIFEAALSRLSSGPGETVFVGDDCEADIAGAREVGMRTIFVQRGPVKCEKADLTIRSIAELPSAIRQISKDSQQL